MFLENENIRLRAVEPQDLEHLYSWENNAALWMVGNTRQPYSKYALKQYIQQTDSTIYESKQLRLMIEDKLTGKTVGTVDLFDFDIHNSRIALGLFVDSTKQGKGYATQALHITEKYVFNFLKINQIYCHIAQNNTASRLMFEKEGYETNGVLKQWINTPDGFENIIIFQKFSYLTRLFTKLKW
ncbi:MAG: GNAT family protein [Paludibacter sp.]|nr:GNAT family protein [Paludibacter sp.]